jgi:hypothetical protein
VSSADQDRFTAARDDRAITIATAGISGARSSHIGIHPDVAWWCALLALCLVLLAPLTMTDVPPLMDYPNHLARLYALAFIGSDPILARFYQPHWAIIPNLGLDLTVPPLMRLFPVHVVGRAVIGVTLLLPIFGAIAYHRAISGRTSWLPFVSALFAYNGALLRGFLNFNLSVGLALLLGAAWTAWRDRRPLLTIGVAAIGAVALFFCHITGLGCFAVLIGAYELVTIRSGSFTIARLAWRFAFVSLVFIAPVVLYASSDLHGMPIEVATRTTTGKLWAAFMPAVNYSLPLDAATALTCAGLAVLSVKRRWCVAPPASVLVIGALGVLFLVLPESIKGGGDLDARFLVMLVSFLPAAFLSAAVSPAAVSPAADWPMRSRRCAIIAAVLIALFSVRMIVLLASWQVWAHNLAAFRSVTASIRPGDVVLSVHRPRHEPLPAWTKPDAERISDSTLIDTHLPALLLIEHDAYWPYLFDNASQQPITTRQPYRAAASLADNSPDPIATLMTRPPEMRPFTHLLVFGTGIGDIPAGGLRLIDRNTNAALFAIEWDNVTRSPPGPPPSGR